MVWRLLSFLVALVPWRALRIPGKILGRVAGRVLCIRRKHVLASMSVAGLVDADRHADGMYESLGIGVFEFLWMAGRSNADLEAFVFMDPGEWALVRGLLSKGRGLVVATAHTGNWDLVASAMTSRAPLAVVTKQLSWRSMNAFWQTARKQRALRLIDTSQTVRRASAMLRQGGIVGCMIDQAPERAHGIVRGPFLGQIAATDTSFALLAARNRSPVVLACAQRLEDGRHQVHVVRTWEPPAAACHTWASQVCLDANVALEMWIRKHPDQWLWLHRRWKMGMRRRRMNTPVTTEAATVLCKR